MQTLVVEKHSFVYEWLIVLALWHCVLTNQEVFLSDPIVKNCKAERLHVFRCLKTKKEILKFGLKAETWKWKNLYTRLTECNKIIIVVLSNKNVDFFYVCELFYLCGSKRQTGHLCFLIELMGHCCFLIELMGWEVLPLEITNSLDIKGLIKVID